MKKLWLVLTFTAFCFLFLFSTILVSGQKEVMKFGKIDTKDISMTRYDLDSTADAVILGDQGESYFEYDDQSGFNLIFDRLLRIKILKKSGYEWASQSIYLYKINLNEEQLSSLKAKTYNLVNGKVVEEKLTDESVFTEVESRNWIVKKFT